MAKLEKGTIVNMQGSYGSGIAILWIQKDGERGAVSVPCENGATVRALSSYVECIGPGHTINVDALKGLEVFYAMDDMGLILDGIIPVENASEEMWDIYENGE